MADKAKNMHQRCTFLGGGGGEQWNEGMLLYSVPSMYIFVQQLRFSHHSESKVSPQSASRYC